MGGGGIFQKIRFVYGGRYLSSHITYFGKRAGMVVNYHHHKHTHTHARPPAHIRARTHRVGTVSAEIDTGVLGTMYKNLRLTLPTLYI